MEMNIFFIEIANVIKTKWFPCKKNNKTKENYSTNKCTGH